MIVKKNIFYLLLILIFASSCKNNVDKKDDLDNKNGVSEQSKKNISTTQDEITIENDTTIKNIVLDFYIVSSEVKKYILSLSKVQEYDDFNLKPDTLIVSNKTTLLTYRYQSFDNEILLLLLLDEKYDLIDYKKIELKYKIIPDEGYLSYKSNVEYLQDSIKIIVTTQLL